ncbi:hypothetical protein CERSUDRAFT_137906 [Gelatoporia subvermispora B]|uniref:Fe2OG dioxygenase domain-containing protein n=1 Tax=Ceriporiopsis subvermispora (strain B) TaxID=914234 RepID=M2PJ85_CERS8|nr:hypothetical protein CERSUDRAFT_137906 [Gelatoporia subvermispora B]
MNNLKSSEPVNPQVEALRRALHAKPPFCSGIFKLHPEGLILYYGKKGNTDRIDCANVSEDELRHLAAVCDPATLGRNDQDVYDESYRRAGKLDSSYFAVKFDPHSCGLLDAIRGDLLEGDKERPIRAELYKLNVYGPGSFFKAHKDTPRGGDMFGSLVLVYPVKHNGGALNIQHEDMQWTSDSATLLAGAQEPCVGYTAFFSDVEHEVTPVVSGYRVTVTYNLYYTTGCDAVPEGEAISIARNPPANETVFKTALQTLLQDESFMASGGTLGFGLRHEYAFDRKDPTKTDLAHFERRFKGSDAMLFRVCQSMGLAASVRVLYKVKYRGRILLDHIVDFNGRWDPEDDLIYWLKDKYHGTVLASDEDPDEYDEDDYEAMNDTDDALHVMWITQYARQNPMSMPFMAYGNEAQLKWAYIHLCLIVEVPAAPRAIST